MQPVQIIGTPVSPFVRKVLVALELKSIPYEIDPIVAFHTDERFQELSPLRLIPVYIDGPLTLMDSTVICEYLDEAYPDRPVLPKDPAQRAKARYLDEYADTYLADTLLWKLFNEAIINPSVWNTPRDLDAIKQVIDNDIPQSLAYLEQILPADGFLFGDEDADMGLADISIAVQFRNAAWARFEPDPADWPRTAAFVKRVLGSPAFQALAPMEDALIKTPIQQQRGVLAEMGIALTAETYLTDGAARPGPLTKRRA